jgi:hypothetical protein
LENCSAHSAHQMAIAQHDKRLDAHGDEIDNLRECVVRLTAIQESNAKWQESNAKWQEVAEERIAALEAAPSKRWDNLVNYVVTAIVALVIGMVAGQIGLN